MSSGSVGTILDSVRSREEHGKGAAGRVPHRRGWCGDLPCPLEVETRVQTRLKLVAVAGALVASTAVAGVGARAATTSGPTDTTSVGRCHGLRGLASVKSDYTDPSDGQPAGLVANIPVPGANHDVRISIKGVAGPDGSFGTCNFSGDNTPGAGTYRVQKWTALLVSPATDCVPDDDNAEYPLNGKTTIEFSDGSRTQTYSQTTFGNGAAHDVFTQTGVVTKGNGLGALFDNEIYYAPIKKVPGSSLATGAATPYPGYQYDTATAGACAGRRPRAAADARDLLVGDGVSGLTGQAASGYTFNVGN